MRIFYASDTTPNAAIKSNLWRTNLYLPLVDLGHDVIEFEYDWKDVFKNLDPSIPAQKSYIEAHRPATSEELVEQVRRADAEKPIDLFFSYFYDACVTTDAIEEIKALGITTVNWYCNGSYQLHLVEAISPHYDWCLVPEKFRLGDYYDMGARPIYCQEAANPSIYKPYDLPKSYDVTFVGQAYGDRPHIVSSLIDKGIDVRVWGKNWDVYAMPSMLRKASRSIRSIVDKKRRNIPVFPANMLGAPLSDLEMVQMFSRSKINIGFSSCGNTHYDGGRILQVRLRDFEVPMSGGFYMVEYMPELEEFFEIGKEVVCYYDEADLAEKIKYYLDHENERDAISEAGYLRAVEDHTWHKRFTDSFRQMGLEADGK
jgi:spore maturation protein CgeB